jgi:hypothetical protein
MPRPAQDAISDRGREIPGGTGFATPSRTFCSGREAPASRPLRRSSSFRDHRPPDAGLRSEASAPASRSAASRRGAARSFATTVDVSDGANAPSGSGCYFRPRPRDRGQSRTQPDVLWSRSSCFATSPPKLQLPEPSAPGDGFEKRSFGAHVAKRSFATRSCQVIRHQCRRFGRGECPVRLRILRQPRATPVSGREAPASRPLRRSSSFQDHRCSGCQFQKLKLRRQRREAQLRDEEGAGGLATSVNVLGSRVSRIARAGASI